MQKATPAVPGQPSSMSPAVREQLQAIIEASGGLLSGLNIDETFQGLHFAAAGGNSRGYRRDSYFVLAGQARTTGLRRMSRWV